MTDSNDTNGQVQAPPPVPPAPPEAPPGPAMPDGPPPRGWGAGVTAGAILVFIGVALLVSRAMPSVGIWQLWPFFVIIPGVIQCFTPGRGGWSVDRFFEGLITVAIGLMLLGNSTGVLGWDVWWELLLLWPVLLITAGLSILGNSLRARWLRVLSSIVVLGALAFASANAYSGTTTSWFGQAKGEDFSASRSVGSSTKGELVLASGVGEIDIESVAGRQVTVEGTTPFGEPALTSSTQGDTTRVEFVLSDREQFVTYPGAPTAQIKATVGDDVPWKVELDTGVAKLDADFSSLELSQVILKTGVSTSEILLGEPADRQATMLVSSGVATVEISVPEEFPARIESESGLTGHDISSDFEPVGDSAWESPDYVDAKAAGRPVWVIRTQSGVGSISVDTY